MSDTSRLPDWAVTLRGIGMGAADVVPGVSGGTVALIVGIYGRLVTAISRFDLRLVSLVRQRRWRDAAAHVDLRFLMALAAGILVGFAAMSLLVHRLLTDPVLRAYTLAAFFGMILASAFIVASMINVHSPAGVIGLFACGLIGAVVAFALTRLGYLQVEIGLGYVFLCGAVAICAMILPGISGAMVLLIMGIYEHLMQIPHDLAHGEQVGPSLLTLVCFGCGCSLGLLSFSKLLKWLLAKYHAITMAVLCGLMIGALAKIWPFQKDLTPDQDDFKLKVFEAVWPSWNATTGGVLLTLGLSAAVVLIVDYRLRLKPGRATTADPAI